MPTYCAISMYFSHYLQFSYFHFKQYKTSHFVCLKVKVNGSDLNLFQTLLHLITPRGLTYCVLQARSTSLLHFICARNKQPTKMTPSKFVHA